MKMIFKSIKISELYTLKGFFENQGIECTIKNENLYPLMGKIPPSESPEIWINKDGDYEQAEKLLKQFFQKESLPKPNAWKCKKCGEMIEGQFTACWKCGESKNDF
ncbi:MAG: DUF2007 domain-containing protein [Candidatus Omnitrophota bacterium]|nr:DUF2007 domain-containing protein [Candidatus Omnitrophota bacterium]